MLSTSQRAPGIAVPVPRAADAAAGFIDPRGKAEPAQAVQHIHAGETRADDDGVEGRADFRRALLLTGSVGRHGTFPVVSTGGLLL